MPGMTELRISIAETIDAVEACEWDACANPNAEQTYNPFISHAFLAALEQSHSVGPRTGWQPQHVLARTAGGALVAAAPCYIKSHSRGEYVFDHGWAEAYARAGGNYYPKLQVAVPFTPATGPRLLVRDTPNSENIARALASGLVEICKICGASGVHVTFALETEFRLLGELGYLQRTDQQFHWENRGFANFDEFLARLPHASARLSAVNAMTLWLTASACIGSPAAILPRRFGTRFSSFTWRPVHENGAAPT
jgi:predicted N-acyltransferase